MRYAEGRGLTRDALEACALLEVARERGLALAAVNHAFLCAQLAPHERATVAARVARYRAGGVAEEGIATGAGEAVEARDDASGARGAAATAAPS